MTKTHLLRAASSLALIAAMSTAAVSQSGGGPSSGGSSPGPAQSEKQQPNQMSPGSGGTTEVPKTRGGAAEKQPDRPQASDRAQEKSSPRSAGQGDSKSDEPGRSRAESDRTKDKGDKSRAESDRTKDKGDKSRAESDRAKDGKRQSQDNDSKDRSRTARDRDGKDDRGDRAGKGKAAQGKRDDSAGERVKISQQQQTTVRERLSKQAQRNRVDRVDFDLRVGVNVPRNVALHVLPPDVVEIVPEYRSYRYVYVGDQIVIIDPSDYMVVAVLGGSSRTAVRRGGSFTLATDDRVFVRSHVERGPAIRLGLGDISIGMSLPGSVELRPVPRVVVDRIPDLEGHDYFYYENEVVIVDPETRQVVYVIDN
jgi:hypothetical protein